MAKGTSGIVWSSSRLNLWFTDPEGYYRKYIAHEKEKVSPWAARGIAVHSRTKNFYKEDGTPKYKSADAFANSVKGPWSFARKTGKIQGREIAWNFEAEPFTVLAEMMNILKIVYGFYSKEKAPYLTEEKFNVVVRYNQRNFHLTGQMDEIRIDNLEDVLENLAVRDNKTAKIVPTEEERESDYQFTFYSLGVASLLLSGDLGQKGRRRVPIFNLEDIFDIATETNLEYHDMRRAKIIPIKKKTPEDFFRLIRDIVIAEEEIACAIKTGIWETKGRSESPDYVFSQPEPDSDYQGKLPEIKERRKIKAPAIDKRPKQQKIRFPRRKKKKDS